MGNFFNLDNPFWNFLGKAWDVIWLTILWFLSLVPALAAFFLVGATESISNIFESGSVIAFMIFGIVLLILTFLIGPATTAFFYVGQKIVNDEEGYITRQYFHSFKQNFKQGSLIWLIMLAIGLVLTYNLWFYIQMGSMTGNIFLVLILFLLWVYMMEMQYVFAVLSKFDNTMKNIFKFSFILSIKKIGWTILMIFVSVVVIVVGLFLFSPILIFAPGIIMIIDCVIISKVFKPYIEQAKAEV